MQGIVRPAQNSLILYLPDELTYDIFLTCHDDDRRSFPWIASTVCSQWRCIALSTPVLWSEINFDRSLHNQQVARNIETQLKRAQMAPLDIHIFQSALHETETESMLQIAELISPSAQRWRSLVIEETVQSQTLQILFDRLTTASVPQLENLVIPRGSGSTSVPGWEFRAFSNGAPRLQFLHLSKCRVDWNSDIFSNLVELEVHDASFLSMDRDPLFTLAWSLLVRSPRLRSLTLADSAGAERHLRNTRTRSPPSPPLETFIHSAIECLVIDVEWGEVTDALLHSVKMPGLQQVSPNRFGAFYYTHPFSFPTLAHFNPLPNLRVIRILGYRHGFVPTPEENAALPLALQVMRNLGVLEFQSLDLTRSDSWLPNLLVWLPRLTYLEFSYCRGLRDSAIREMVQCGSNSKRLTLALSGRAGEFFGQPPDRLNESKEEFKAFLVPLLGELSAW
ncbi:hypothetical protein FRC01_004117 [Tulasnella sp. 417]|nr:hypothetical protein FRC01_004117 [Tulasnella sp. 417]